MNPIEFANLRFSHEQVFTASFSLKSMHLFYNWATCSHLAAGTALRWNSSCFSVTISHATWSLSVTGGESLSVRIWESCVRLVLGVDSHWIVWIIELFWITHWIMLGVVHWRLLLSHLAALLIPRELIRVDH